MQLETDLFLGCNLPHDSSLTEEGWEWRCNADGNRARDMVDTYRELGFEVRLVAVQVDALSESCAACSDSLGNLSAVYVRKLSRLASP